MSDFLRNVSDETLFLKMSQGDKTAQGVLLSRYERVGFQYVNQLIRINNLKNYGMHVFQVVFDFVTHDGQTSVSNE